MLKNIIKAGIIFLITVNVSTAKNSNLNKLLSESLDIYNQWEKIDGPRRAAQEDMAKKLGYVSKSIALLKQPPFDEKKIKRYTDSIAQLKKYIDMFQTYIDMAKVTDPNERAKLAQKYENDWQRLLTEEAQAKKPYNKRIEQLKREVADKQGPFEKAMKAYCLFPANKYQGLDSTVVYAQYHKGKLRYVWNTCNGHHERYGLANRKSFERGKNHRDNQPGRYPPLDPT